MEIHAYIDSFNAGSYETTEINLSKLQIKMLVLLSPFTQKNVTSSMKKW